MTMTRAYADTFPRRQAYSGQTYDGRQIIGFEGYEAVQQRDGSWTLIATPGGHDAARQGNWDTVAQLAQIGA